MFLSDRTSFTVGKLREWLQHVPDNTLVVLQRDSVGTAYRRLDIVEIEENIAYDEEHREVRYARMTDDLAEDGIGDEEIAAPGSRPCVVLIPED